MLSRIRKNQASSIIIMVFLLIMQTNFALAEDTSGSGTAKEVSTFAMSPDLAGQLSNSVNLFTGDVNFSLNLVTLKGRNGMYVNVSVVYNSNVQNIVDTWNLEAPTGILGLGWLMNYGKIIVNHKNTGTHSDNEFYLVGGGVLNLLVAKIEGSETKYYTKIYNFWDISFDTVNEVWTIIKEDGT